jgi:hypothetical protein
MPRPWRHPYPWGLTVLGVLLALAAGGPGEALAGRARADLEVSARVPVALDYALLDGASGLTLTAQDLAAGVKDVPDATVLFVRTNSPDGFLLELALPAAPWLAAVEGRAGAAVARGAPGTVLRLPVPDAGPGGAGVTRVDLRLHLAPGAAPGDYPLAVSVALSPL